MRIRELGPVDLVIAPQECVCLSGPSGAGKTSLLRAMADLDPHDGRIYLDETDSSRIEPASWRRQVALLPEESQWWRDTVGAHFASGVDAWLAELDLDPEIMCWPVSRLSNGERQRLALLRILTNGPQALLLDEPTSVVDEVNAERIEALVARYRSRSGAAVLWVTHDLAQIPRVATRHFTLHRGRLAAAPCS
ncbi:MAG: ABC transporter ATP-binding protein [Gammaproteobacteria bacterium]